MTENYLGILQEDLNKKSNILDGIAAYCEQQEKLLKQEKLPLEEFDALVDEKDKLIKEIARLDEGFETVYARIKEQLMGNRNLYQVQIASLQQLISVITEKSVSIQAREARNKVLVEQHFAEIRKGMHQNVKSTKAAYSYYKNANQSNYVPSQFLDQKQ